MPRKPNRKERRQNPSIAETKNSSLELCKVEPRTINQKSVFKNFNLNKNLVLHGVPGSGKTFLALYLALKEILDGKTSRKKVTIIRSSQPSKQIGFLPGSAKQKMEVYETPYKAICTKLFDRGDAYEILKQKNLIEFESTSFLRGTTIDDSIIILDEAQNLLFTELKTALTRCGDTSRIIICGDVNQDDLTSLRFREESGLDKVIKILKNIPSIIFIEFGVEDIQRSGFVKEFILAELDIIDYVSRKVYQEYYIGAD